MLRTRQYALRIKDTTFFVRKNGYSHKIMWPDNFLDRVPGLGLEIRSYTALFSDVENAKKQRTRLENIWNNRKGDFKRISLEVVPVLGIEVGNPV